VQNDPTETHSSCKVVAVDPGAKLHERESSSPEQSVGYSLSQLGFETSRRFGEIIATVGLEPRQFALLRAVARSDGQSQQALAEPLHIPASTMVAVVDSLEHAGFLERRLHASDRRTRTIHLTPDGADVLARATALAWSWEGVICSGFRPSERAQLLGLLARVAGNIGVVPGSLPHGGSGAQPSHTSAVAMKQD
jgi:DNA-binding MarR family transcriptional regulator